MTAAYLISVTQTPPQTSMGVFENLKIPKMLGFVPSTQGTAKIWTGKLEILESNQALTFKQVGEVQVIVTDFSARKPTPITEQILANHERGLLTNTTLAASHFRKTVCTFSDKKVVVLDGSTIFNTPQKVAPMYMISFAFVEGTQLYQFQALSFNQEKYEDLLVSLDGMTLGGDKVSGWATSAAGTFSIARSPFSVKSPKALFPVLGEKDDESLGGQYIGAVNVPKGANYRYVLANLKENDSRSDAEILAVLTRIAVKAEVPQGFNIDPTTSKGQFTYMDGTVKKEAQVEFRRKGKVAAIVAASRVPTGYPFGGVELVEAK